ncbi:MAG: hypothetical protein N2317_01330 [Syntrophales bacterium]|nr:hypothetical protein [Syntrophales bacterium]
MKINMPIKFHGNYVVIIKTGDKEDRERCQKLTVRELTAEEIELAYRDAPQGERPTHQVTFYDFGCKRIIEGTIKDNTEDRLSFVVKDKEYIFTPFVPRSQKTS